MAKYTINQRFKSVFKKTGKKPIMRINFLGTGSGFNPKLGGSSMVIQYGKTILVDCGPGVFEKLIESEYIDKIDYIFITHTHEDHISSLASIVSYRKVVFNKETKIETLPSIKEKIEQYLEICGCEKIDFFVNLNGDKEYFDDLDLKIFKIDTSGLHSDNINSCGFVFYFRHEGNELFIVYSGDLKTSFIEVLKEKRTDIFEKMISCNENVFIFHEATPKELSMHCNYKVIEPSLDVFPNIFIYHHNVDEANEMTREQNKLIFESEKELDEFDKKSKEILVGEENTVENRRLYESERMEYLKRLSLLKKSKKLISLTQLIDADFFIEKLSEINS